MFWFTHLCRGVIIFYSKTNRFKNPHLWSSHCGTAETNPTSIHEDVGSTPGLAQRVKDLVLPRAVV